MVNGDVTYVKRRVIAAGLPACHENAENVITTPLRWLKVSFFFCRESRPPLDLPN